MNQTVISEGQSIVDVALQELGSLTALFDLADAAGLAITDALAAGQVLPVPASASGQPEVTAYFAGRQQRLNTGDVAVVVPRSATQRYFSKQFFNPDTYA